MARCARPCREAEVATDATARGTAGSPPISLCAFAGTTRTITSLSLHRNTLLPPASASHTEQRAFQTRPGTG